MATESLDPITVEVVRYKLDGIANEMQSTLLRSSFSPIVKEGLDASASLFTPDGTTLSQSCSIPIHLATREAMKIYKDKLAPHGAVVMHVSNRHLELASVVVGIADANGLKSWVYNEDSGRDDEYIFATNVVVSARDDADVGALTSSDKWALTDPTKGQRVWTDDYSNILGAVWRRLRDGEDQ